MAVFAYEGIPQRIGMKTSKNNILIRIVFRDISAVEWSDAAILNGCSVEIRFPMVGPIRKKAPP